MELINAFYIRVTAALFGNIFVRLLLIVVCADMIFGSLRAIKYRCMNSCIGIDGATRKAGMVASVVLFTIVDVILRVDLMSWLPIEARNAMNAVGIVKAGVTELFAILYILYEAISVLKNMLLCGLPVPAGIREKLTTILDKWTDETMPETECEEMTADRLELSVCFDRAQLEAMGLDNLRAMADRWGMDYDENATAADLAAMIDSGEVTVGF